MNLKKAKEKGGIKMQLHEKLKNSQNNYSKQNGITLIALVVTIVVLLILAGVSINALFGQNGIIQRAKDAQNKMDQATQNDLDSINSLNEWIDSTANGTVVGKEGSLLAMYQKAQKENCDNADGQCDNATHLHIGDYVDYKNPTSGTAEVTSAESGVYGKDSDGNETVNITQTYTLSESKNNVKWRVLGIDSETGGLKLIAADPIERDANSALLEAVGETTENPYLYLGGAEAYVYGPKAMDEVSGIYLNSTYSTKARSVTIDDINEITGVTTEDKIKEVNIWPVQDKEAKQYGETYTFEKGYTPELWLQIGKKADVTKEIKPFSNKITSYAYVVNCAEEIIPQVKMTNTRVNDMLFKDVDKKVYWLASCAVEADSSGAKFGPGAVAREAYGVTYIGFGNASFASNGKGNEYWGSSYFAVRPVVILKSDVMAETMPKIADQASTWTYVAPSDGN